MTGAQRFPLTAHGVYFAEQQPVAGLLGPARRDGTRRGTRVAVGFQVWTVVHDDGFAQIPHGICVHVDAQEGVLGLSLRARCALSRDGWNLRHWRRAARMSSNG